MTPCCNILEREHTMSNIPNMPSIKPELGTAIKAYVAKARGLDAARSTALDLMTALGWKASDLLSPKSADSTATAEGYAWIKSQIVAGFTADVQKLLARETTKGMTDLQKVNRKYWQQQIGAKLNDLRSGLTKREQVKASGGASSRTRTFFEVADDQLAKWEKRLADEIADAKMQGEVMKAMRGLQALIRKAAKSA